MTASHYRLAILSRLCRAGLHLARGRKLRKYIRDNKIVIDLGSHNGVSPRRVLHQPLPIDALPYRVIRDARPAAGAPACLFATYAPDGRIWPHTRDYMRAIRRLGVFVVHVAATDRDDLLCEDAGEDAADAMIVRRNGGYDFPGWALALRLAPELWRAGGLFLANDSVYGPFASFPALVERMRRSSADLVGLTESLEIRHHFQSYFLLMQPSALAHSGMRAFWDGVRILDDKLAVVKEYETGLKQFAEERGMTTEAMFPLARNGLSPRRNPTMHDWRDLVERGFPFVKVSLLRDNPLLIDLRGWRDLLASHGARLDAIDLHLGGVNPKAPGLIMR